MHARLHACTPATSTLPLRAGLSSCYRKWYDEEDVPPGKARWIRVWHPARLVWLDLFGECPTALPGWAGLGWAGLGCLRGCVLAPTRRESRVLCAHAFKGGCLEAPVHLTAAVCSRRRRRLRLPRDPCRRGQGLWAPHRGGQMRGAGGCWRPLVAHLRQAHGAVLQPAGTELPPCCCLPAARLAQVDNGHYGLLDIGSGLVMPCRQVEWKGVKLRVPADVEGVLRHRWAAPPTSRPLGCARRRCTAAACKALGMPLAAAG